VELRLIGGGRYRLDGVSFTDVAWSAESEVEELAKLDVGLLPVPDSPWNRRKFFMKLIQYMSVGAVPVCTPIGDNPLVVEHGVNGLLASERREWSDGLRRLVEDREWRGRLSEQAIRTAQRGYTVQARAVDILEAFQAALG